MTAPITHRPLQRTPRRNAEGLWRCTGKFGCGRYFPRETFWERADGNGPVPWCKDCSRARCRKRHAAKAMDDTWWAQQVAIHRKYTAATSRARAKRQRERAEMAEVLLQGLARKGLTVRNVGQATGLNDDCLRAMRRRGTLRDTHVLGKLTLLFQICQDFPELHRTRGSRAHPHLAEITYRYQAVMAAHT